MTAPVFTRSDREAWGVHLAGYDAMIEQVEDAVRQYGALLRLDLHQCGLWPPVLPDLGSNVVDLWPLRGRDKSIQRQRTAARVLIAALFKAWSRNSPLEPALEGFAAAIEALAAEAEVELN